MVEIDDKFRGAVVGLAVGDAVGAAGVLDPSLRDVPVADMTNTLYTDDTQMAVCVAQALVAGKKDCQRFSEALCESFIGWSLIQKTPECRRAPDPETISACQRIARRLQLGTGAVAGLPNPVIASRTPLVGVFFHANIPETIDFAMAATSLTHGGADARVAGTVAALMALYAFLEVPTGLWAYELSSFLGGIDNHFLRMLDRTVELAQQNPQRHAEIGLGRDAKQALCYAMLCCMRHRENFKAAVLEAANCPGSPDSVAAVVGACMGAKLGLSAIPKEWAERVEDSAELVKLGDQMASASL